LIQSPAKDPRKSEGGSIGVRRRWDADAIRRGLPPGPRILRLDSLSAGTRAIIEAAIRAERNAADPPAA